MSSGVPAPRQGRAARLACQSSSHSHTKHGKGAKDNRLRRRRASSARNPTVGSQIAPQAHERRGRPTPGNGPVRDGSSWHWRGEAKESGSAGGKTGSASWSVLRGLLLAQEAPQDEGGGYGAGSGRPACAAVARLAALARQGQR